MKHKWLLIVGVLVVLIGIGVWSGKDTYAAARVGTVYVAKQTCSCLFVAKRPLDSCYTDFDTEATRPLDVSVSQRNVTVSAFGGMISARAQYESGYGCHPVN
ncbi:MAG: hypothetical protein ABW171_05760 [Steroidobacter sp.]